MMLLLLALQTSQPAADTVLAAARRAVSALGDTAAVRAAGYRPIAEIGIPDGLPFQGQHWSVSLDTLRDVPLERPAFIMFGIVDGAARRIGVAYAAGVPLNDPPLVGLGGDASAEWHNHYWCEGVPGQPRGFVVNDTVACGRRGGTLSSRRNSMVHVWTDVANPYGQYGHDNPALPFVAVGLTPPTARDLHDHARELMLRRLGMALGETYDARLPVARRIMRENTNASLADSAAQRRAAIAALIPALKRAESLKQAEYDRVAGQIIVEWEALVALYQRMAATPQLQTQVLRANQRVTEVSAHH